MEPNKKPPAHNRPRMFVKKGKNREKIETAVVNAELRHVFQFRCYSTLSCPDVVLVDFLVFPVFFSTQPNDAKAHFSFPFFSPMPSLSFPASYHRSPFRSFFFFQITASFSMSYSACRNLSSLQRVVPPSVSSQTRPAIS
ncbi:Hypothetical protein, putative [Bodo saltans]|uniref:Uncharacterized protein n=1 Tax=Bodo saltans TaxID=75058 RepID=A0A0S4JDQ3_BODSA|nr:Hypothetical protein, putative [Bodo saltans]|eukprot:CUG88586.1 Hypothetical protein, putative [Bodo saltans]